MLQIALYEPEIPPNTGNIIRLCANTGAGLHLIHPLGFTINDKQLRRAGLDYHETAVIHEYDDYADFGASGPVGRLLACTTRGTQSYNDIAYRPDDILLFGPETRGLPQDLLDALPEPQRLYIPMQPGNRSLNLSNAVAVILYEAWRQLGFGS